MGYTNHILNSQRRENLELRPRRLIALGQGIPDEFKNHIFDKFVQAEGNDARAKGGTGLGLSIVRGIVEQLGGEVGFETAPGGGTIFYVTLPS